VKFLIQVLSDWPTPASTEDGSRDSLTESAPAKIVLAVDGDGSTATLAVLQANEFHDIPEHALVSITKLDD
jgi:hypothetical protein